MSAKSPDAIDRLVGRNIRIQRLAKGLSQTDLAAQLGVSFQQVQKYERGANRIGAGRLVRIADTLDVSLLTLFEASTMRTGRMAPPLRPCWRSPPSLPGPGVFAPRRRRGPPRIGQPGAADGAALPAKRGDCRGLNGSSPCVSRFQQSAPPPVSESQGQFRRKPDGGLLPRHWGVAS